MKADTLLITAVLLALTASSHAAIVIDTESSTGTPLASTPWFGRLSADDLINAGQPTLASVTRDGVFFGNSGPNDGQSTQTGGASDTTTNTYIPSEASGALASKFTEPGGEWWATYNLNLTTNIDGYDITSIESFMGFNANSELQGNQLYSVDVSTVGSSVYVPLTSVSYAPFTSVDGVHHFSHVAITEDESGVLATNVDSIRFRLRDPGNGAGVADGTVINELDVHGVASAAVPEPSSLLLVGVMAALAAVGRHSSRSWPMF